MTRRACYDAGMTYRIHLSLLLFALIGATAGCDRRPYPQPLDARDNLPPPASLEPAVRHP